MDFKNFLPPPADLYFVGIKGTGTCALAELMLNAGYRVSGSDTGEVFYTDAILKELGIPCHESFRAEHIKDHTGLVIHSAAWSPETNPELAEARRRGIPVMKYPEALGAWSALFDSSGIAGVHGKTTTAAMAGTLVRALGIPAQVLAGSAVASFGNRSTLSVGDKYFIAETCEYRRHFLFFHPSNIVLTAVEEDHQDYYPDFDSIRDAFLEYCRLLPPGGTLVYCADDDGAAGVARTVEDGHRGIRLIPYGFSAGGPFRIESYRVPDERAEFRLSAFPDPFILRVPGRHEALNAAAALALCTVLLSERGQDEGEIWNGERRKKAKEGLEQFRGAKRRSEIIGEAGGILFMDDYGHHPTAIAATLEGLREFYPRRRIIVSFMSHTYTRTAALLDEFAASFGAADVVVLHKIYASARETNPGGVDGRTLFEKTRARRSRDGRHGEVFYTEEPMDALPLLRGMLRGGDLFITMGAGNNWPLGEALFARFGGEKP
ncbi:MAG: UDP-N-acetylmuramate--L-alanine ligase [Treponema sp.]|jgi:UDP-N-acetylmuramate--alanine ligase|nr:UDP-N-acetylmuramate--L-alanine ligase [Treponema sp.]